MNDRYPTPERKRPHEGRAAGLLVAGVLLTALVVAVAAVGRLHPWKQPGELPGAFDYDLDKYTSIDPAWIKYREAATWEVPLEEVRGIAAGPQRTAYVAGDRAICVLDDNGALQKRIELEQPPLCLDVAKLDGADPGTMYLGMRDRVEVYSPPGKRVATWESRGPKAVLTSIEATEQNVFVADAGNRVVLRYDLEGKLLGEIGRRNEQRNIPGLLVPSPYLDIAMAPDGLLRVVNPGRHRIEAYTPEGFLELHWGEAGLALEKFCGCCNPAHIGILDDGRVVTAEKGILRVKVYEPDGRMLAVVAGPAQLMPAPSATEETRQPHRPEPTDVVVMAADASGNAARILLLDGARRQVRVFEPLAARGNEPPPPEAEEKPTRSKPEPDATEAPEPGADDPFAEDRPAAEAPGAEKPAAEDPFAKDEGPEQPMPSDEPAADDPFAEDQPRPEVPETEKPAVDDPFAEDENHTE